MAENADWKTAWEKVMGDLTHTKEFVPRTFRRILYSLYSILFICVLMFCFVQPAVFVCFRIGGATEEKRRRLRRFIHRTSAFIVRRIPGTKYVLENRPGETFEKPAVIVSNHQSHLDLMCLLALIPDLIVLTNDWAYRNPLYGLLIRCAGFCSVSDGIDVGKISGAVANGCSVLVFPEGTRSADCSIQRFHRGAFYLAEQLDLDIVPVILHGVGDVLPKNDFLLREGELYTEIHGRISPDGTSYQSRCSQVHRFCKDRFQQIRSERAGADYWSWYTLNKFRRSGCRAFRACREEFLENSNYRALTDVPPSAPSVVVRNNSTGAFALNYALAHPGTEVYVRSFGKSLEKAGPLPENLHLCASCQDFPSEDFLTIDLGNEGGRHSCGGGRTVESEGGL